MDNLLWEDNYYRNERKIFYQSRFIFSRYIYIYSYIYTYIYRERERESFWKYIHYPF